MDTARLQRNLEGDGRLPRREIWKKEVWKEGSLEVAALDRTGSETDLKFWNGKSFNSVLQSLGTHKHS